MPPLLSQLSSDELGQIFQFLSVFEIVHSVSLVSKEWMNICHDHVPLRLEFPPKRLPVSLFKPNQTPQYTFSSQFNPKLYEFVKVIDQVKFKIVSDFKVSGNRMGMEGIDKIIVPLLTSSSNLFASLKSLNLSNNALGDDALQRLVSVSAFQCIPNLERLDLSNNTDIHSESVQLLIQALNQSNIKLTELNLRGNTGMNHAEFLNTDSPSLSSLKFLDLSSINIGMKGLKSLFENTNLQNLTCLHLNHCEIGLEGAQYIAQCGNCFHDSSSAPLKHLKILHLDGNPIRTKGAKEIVTSAYWSSKLTHLVLMPNLTYNLGYIYENGEDGVTQDHTLALYYYKKAAEQKEVLALNGLGQIYRDGALGQEKNLEKAIEYFQKAAELGDIPSYYSIAQIYYFTIKDLNKTFEILEKGADAGCIESQYLLGVLNRNGYGCEKNFVGAFQYFFLSSLIGSRNADYGLPMACIFKGHMFFNGETLSKESQELRDEKAFDCYYSCLRISSYIPLRKLASLNMVLMSKMGKVKAQKQLEMLSWSQNYLKKHMDFDGDVVEFKKSIKECCDKEFEQLLITRESTHCSTPNCCCYERKIEHDMYCEGCKILKRDQPVIHKFLSEY
ncbi:hypothetical protein C9374_001002 [Naegleria lovaniensis]|uniref:F-box domain-containing protein n=1 Tax=Naegleria lovaniensis TaxID=51637 RepID=A0AA88KSM6_NAELO|nr:uncharacterized protein C9374_001002 [Naegleria lovaniensis]KAG2388152.1 hypothetical protein C9374_001002 [Naegleria lovaniensis]